MLFYKMIKRNSDTFLIELEITKISEEGRLVAKSPKKNIKPKTPITKTKAVKKSDSVNKPNIVK